MGKCNIRGAGVANNISTPRSWRWQIKAVIASMILSIVFYAGISIYAGWAEVLVVFGKIGWVGLIVALLLSLLNYVLRFGRWQFYLLRLRHKLPVLPSWRIYLSGFALTTTPGKAGEVIRCLFLKDYGVPMATSLAALISERLSDLVAVVLLSCLGLMRYPQAHLPVLITVVIILVLWALMAYRSFPALLHRVADKAKGGVSLLLHKMGDTVEQTQQCHNIPILLLTTFSSVIAWGAEALAFYFLLLWCGYDVGFTFAMFVYAISMLVGALTFLPGGLGGAEAAMVSLLIWQGIDAQSALAVTIFIRLTTLWFAVILGVIALYWHRLIKEEKYG